MRAFLSNGCLKCALHLLLFFSHSYATCQSSCSKGLSATKFFKTLSICGISASFSFCHLQPSLAVAPKLGECVEENNPSATIITCRKLGMVKGSLQGCQSQENCFSTSAKAASKYSSPWRYDFNTKSIDKAWEKLVNAVEAEGLKVLKKDETMHYILAAEKNVPKVPVGSSLFYEFLLKDNTEEKLVLYRGVVDKTVLLYPLQTPVSDFGALNNRLDGILKRTGWLKVGGDGLAYGGIRIP